MPAAPPAPCWAWQGWRQEGSSLHRSLPFLLPHRRWGRHPARRHAPPAPRGNAHLPSHPRGCKRLHMHAHASRTLHPLGTRTRSGTHWGRMPDPCPHPPRCLHHTRTQPSSCTHWGCIPTPAPTGDRGVRSSCVSPTLAPYPPHTRAVSPASPQGLPPACPTLPAVTLPAADPSLPTRRASPALGTLSPSSLDRAGALSPLLPPAAPVRASLMPQSHAVLFLQSHSLSKGTS